ncbi:MAG: YbjQ family protein [Candidatus Micrarchaeota archaeon]
MIITTTDFVAGKKVKEVMGIVRGNTIRARHVGHDILAGLQQIIGGELQSYTKMLTDTRNQATERMVAEAEKLGADAVINVRYASSDIMPGAAEILAYGTAVKLD